MIIDKFALQLFSVRDAFSDDPEAVLREITEMGYRGVEATGFDSISPEKMKAVCDELGLEIYSMHGGENDLLSDNIGATVKTLSALKCDTFVLAWIGGTKDYDTVMRICERFNSYASELEKRGIHFVFHNHDADMTHHACGKSSLELMFDNTSDSVSFELDTGWATFGGGNVGEIVSRYGDRIPLIHLKQIKSMDERIVTELQNGSVIDIKQTIRDCLAHGIDRFIVEQDDSTIGEMKSARMNAEYIFNL